MTAVSGVPQDTFAIRLAIVRAVMGWNYDQAARATGIGSETWRTWEKGTRRCTDILGAAQKIAAATDLSIEWLVLGGPLAPAALPETQPAHQQKPVTSGYRRHIPGERLTAALDHTAESGSAERLVLIRTHQSGVSRSHKVAA